MGCKIVLHPLWVVAVQDPCILGLDFMQWMGHQMDLERGAKIAPPPLWGLDISAISSPHRQQFRWSNHFHPPCLPDHRLSTQSSHWTFLNPSFSPPFPHVHLNAPAHSHAHPWDRHSRAHSLSNVHLSFPRRCKSAFQALQGVITSVPSPPDPTLPFILDTYTSNFGIVTVLVREGLAVERVVACYSRTFNKIQRNYCVTRLGSADGCQCCQLFQMLPWRPALHCKY